MICSLVQRLRVHLDFSFQSKIQEKPLPKMSKSWGINQLPMAILLPKDRGIAILSKHRLTRYQR